jgi:hypothetical protein
MPDGSYRSGLSQDVVSEIARERAEALAEVARLRGTLEEIARRSAEAPMEDLIDAGRIARQALQRDADDS